MAAVLLVDDEVVAVNALKRRMNWKEFGIDHIFEANSMQQAVQVLETEEIDILLCDIEMPGGSGLELLEWVRGYFPYVECIFITCHPDFEYIQKALRLGSFDYILKPIDYEELAVILKNVLQRIEKNRRIKEPIHKKAREKLGDSEISLESQKDVIDQLIQYIRLHLADNFGMEELAGVVHLNPQYMMRIFKKHQGVSILSYLTNERIKMAKELLEKTDYPIYQVADMVGYSNYNYFSRLFKKQTEITPQDYRNLQNTKNVHIDTIL